MALLSFTGAGGRRLDHFLQDQLPQYSRSRIQDWIKAGRVAVDGVSRKPSYDLRGGEAITVEPAELAPLQAAAEAIPLDILYEDADVIAVNKPAGMVVHAGAGVHSGTLVNAILGRYGQLSTVAGDDRPGIVHRLDRETSGVILVARHDAAHRALARQFAARGVEKTYLALVEGEMPAAEGRIDTPILRDPVRRTRMMTRAGAPGRSALTWWKVQTGYSHSTLLSVRIGTGRTHQIRVHLASIRHPVVGDTLYGARPVASLGRFFLHAHRIVFTRPGGSEQLTVEAPLAPELTAYLASLQPAGLE